MDKTIKRKWVKVLRSCKVKQSRTYLKHKEKDDTDWRYCVFGMLLKAMGIQEDVTYKSGNKLYCVFSFFVAEPPNYVLRKALITEEQRDKLITWNDRGRSFKWLAAYIDRYM